MIIRRAQPGEREALEDLQRRASLALAEHREQLEANPDAIDLPADQVGSAFVADIDGSVAGFAVLLGGELDGLFVDPDYWRQGIGTALVEAAVHEARRQGLTVQVVASPTAQGFYETCGFRQEGEEATRFGPAIRMSR